MSAKQGFFEAVFPVKLVDFSDKQTHPFVAQQLKQRVREALSHTADLAIKNNPFFLEEKFYGDMLLQDSLEPAWLAD